MTPMQRQKIVKMRTVSKMEKLVKVTKEDSC
jgi:hypothetical protein